MRSDIHEKVATNTIDLKAKVCIEEAVEGAKRRIYSIEEHDKISVASNNTINNKT